MINVILFIFILQLKIIGSCTKHKLLKFQALEKNSDVQKYFLIVINKLSFTR